MLTGAQPWACARPLGGASRHHVGCRLQDPSLPPRVCMMLPWCSRIWLTALLGCREGAASHPGADDRGGQRRALAVECCCHGRGSQAARCHPALSAQALPRVSGLAAQGSQHGGRDTGPVAELLAAKWAEKRLQGSVVCRARGQPGAPAGVGYAPTCPCRQQAQGPGLM